MASLDQRLRHVMLKTERAKEHITDLERQLRAFLVSEPYKVGFRQDSETRRLIYYVTSVEPVPDCVSLIAGDAIQNLMGALDHLAYQIVCSDTWDNPPSPNRIYFPIFDDVAKYENGKARKMEGARKETFDAIDALKPYRAGNEPLWILHRLNNIEKHRLLLTVGSQAAGIHLGELMAEHLGPGFRAGAVEAFRSMDIFLNPADKGFPLRAGFPLYMGSVDEKPNPRLQFRFDVALDEPSIVEGKPLLETMHALAAVVEAVVSALSPRLQ